MKKLRFGIDIDGTVTCPTSLLPHINERFGCSLVLDDIKEYDLTKAFPVGVDEFYNWYREAEPIIYRSSPAHAYAREILTLWGQKYELFYISARGMNVYDVTKDWFEREQIPYDHIELIGSHKKIETARKFAVDAFFEDKHDNAVEIHEALDIPVFLFDTPYNRLPVPNGVYRVQNWREANEKIEQIFQTETIQQSN